MEFITKLSLASQSKLLAGEIALFDGSIKLGENLVVGGMTYLNGLTENLSPINFLVSDSTGKIFTTPFGPTGGGLTGDYILNNPTEPQLGKIKLQRDSVTYTEWDGLSISTFGNDDSDLNSKIEFGNNILTYTTNENLFNGNVTVRDTLYLKNTTKNISFQDYLGSGAITESLNLSCGSYAAITFSVSNPTTNLFFLSGNDYSKLRGGLLVADDLLLAGSASPNSAFQVGDIQKGIQTGRFTEVQRTSLGLQPYDGDLGLLVYQRDGNEGFYGAKTTGVWDKLAWTSDLAGAFILANPTVQQNANINLTAFNVIKLGGVDDLVIGSQDLVARAGAVRFRGGGIELHGPDILFVNTGDGGGIYGRFGNGSNGPFTEFGHMRITNAPINDLDVVRLVDLTTGLSSYSFSAILGQATDNLSLANALNDKVSKVNGYDLSQENFSTFEKNKLANLSEHFKGYYTSVALLITTNPTGVQGDYANVDEGVGEDAKMYIWDVDDVKWVLSSGGGIIPDATETLSGIIEIATVAEALARTDDTRAMTAFKTITLILDEKKNVTYQVNPIGINEVSIYMENAGQVNSLILSRANNGKLKIGTSGIYPTDAQTYPFTYNAGDDVFVTFNYNDLLQASANVKLKCKDN